MFILVFLDFDVVPSEDVEYLVAGYFQLSVIFLCG
jgi:hypothetical protein